MKEEKKNEPQKSDEDSKEILIFKGEQIWQKQLRELSPEARKRLNENILNSPRLKEAIRNLQDGELKKNENK